MDFEKMLTDSSRLIGDMTADAVGDNPAYFEEILQLALADNGTMAMRAARVVELCGCQNPDFAVPNLPGMINFLPQCQTDGVKRAFAKLCIQYFNDVPQNLLSKLLDIGFKWLEPNEPIALQAYAIQILYEISEREPDFKHELIIILSDILQHTESKGVRGRAKKILNTLYKQTAGKNM